MEETITEIIEQLERLLGNREFIQECETSEYNELLEENIKLQEENKWLQEQLEYWDKEYMKQDLKIEEYRNKYLKWKKKSKELIGQEKRIQRKPKCNKCNKYGHHIQDCKKMNRKCYTCGRKGHKQKNCYKNQICEKCNRKGHMKQICRNRKLTQ